MGQKLAEISVVRRNALTDDDLLDQRQKTDWGEQDIDSLREDEATNAKPRSLAKSLRDGNNK